MYKLSKIGIKSIERSEPEVMYDLNIDKNHNLFYNGVLVHNSDYRGALKFRFRLLRKDNPMLYQKGDRIGQIKLIAKTDMEILEVDELSETQRGEGGFGSTGK